MHPEQIIRDALALPPSAISYHVSQYLADNHPGRALVEGEDRLFNVEAFARGGNCTIERRKEVHDQLMTHWRGREMALPGLALLGMRMARLMSGAIDPAAEDGGELLENSRNAWLRVTWRGAVFDVVIMNWAGQLGPAFHYWILADTRAAAEELILAVCTWNSELRGEVLVFDGGCWQKDAHLFEAIKGASFDNLILRGSLKEDIFADLSRFFAAREVYAAHGVPWKRGILLVGPPGNGKTHAVKAIINAMGQRCLYVKSFRAEHVPEEANIRQVFDRARRSAPCILVLEDLDALVTAETRSFFLNELDGFAANIGVVTLATTNHPERLDPAIVDRPSRFDRKYPFALPAAEERLAYAQMWNASLAPELRASPDGLAAVAAATEGFSFAYLKELFLCSMMRWMSGRVEGAMDRTMAEQVGVLREQMMSAPPEESAATPRTRGRAGMGTMMVMPGGG